MKLQEVFNDLPDLETERTLLRKMKRQDEQELFAICSDEETARMTTWEKHETLEDTRKFIDFIIESYANQQVAPWGIEDKETGKFIGTCGFANWNPYHLRGELAAALSRKFWGKGYITEVVKEIIRFVFAETDLVRIEAHSLPENIGSGKALERAGMAVEGILRKYMFVKGKHLDIKVYAIVK